MTLSLVTVGTGTVAPSATRGSPAHWVERDGLRLLLDCGAGTMHRLARCGLAWDQVTHIALSHFHPDHFGELPALLFALRHATTRVGAGGRPRPAGARCSCCGASPTASAPGCWTRAIRSGYSTCRRASRSRWGSEATLDVHPTPHTAESVALAVQAPEGRLVYTGDTGPSDELGRWAEGADLLLAECSLPDDQAIAGHLTPRERRPAGAAGGAAKRLVLTHFYPQVEQVDIRAGGRARVRRAP